VTVAVRTLAFLLSLVFVFVVPWEGTIELPGLGTAAKMIGLATGAAWVASVLITNRFRKPRPFHVMVCLFVLWNALSLFWSAEPGRTLAHVVTWVQLLGMVFIIWDLYTTRAALFAGLQAFILGEYVAIAGAVGNYLAGNPFYTQYERFSPAAQTGPDGFGFMVVLGIPVAWYLASSMNTRRMNSLFKLVNYAYIPTAFVGLALSGTRTALLASVFGIAFGLSSLTRVRLAARIPIFVALAAAILVALPHVQSLRSFQRLGTTYSEIRGGNLNRRTEIWREGLAVFPQHPIIGVGSNTYRTVNSMGKLAHNSFLSVLVELGVIGLTLFGFILAIALIEMVRQPKWHARFWLTMLAVWFIGASALTYEYRKATWLFLSLAVVSAALTRHRDEGPQLDESDESGGPILQQDRMREPLPAG
jgi:O-antigen ligase